MKETEENEKDIINEMISKINVTLIKKILAASFRIKGSELKGINAMLRNWAKAKKDIYLALDRNIKIEKEIEYTADSYWWKEQYWQLVKKYPIFHYVADSIPYGDCQEDVYRPFSRLDHHVEDAKEGMKLSKFLSKAMNNKEFDIDYSKIMEKGVVKGKIVISIDPLDFILMSCNNSGWTSCHTISKDGKSRYFGEYARRHI